jgi:hypothetical protein
MRKLTLDDVPELRAYSKQRDELRRAVIALKARRRVAVGPVVTFVFENTDTARWQVCEMVRTERIATEEGVETEIKIYNELIPDPGELSATMFIELTSDAELREWLPKLVGIQRSVAFVLPDGSEVRGFDPEEERLTREEVTAAVHFLKFRFSPAQIEAFRQGPVHLRIDHAAYRHEVELNAEQHAALVADFA